MDIQTIAQWIVSHPEQIAAGYLIVVGAASWVVKLFPILKGDSWLLPAIKFIGKFIAVNKTVTEEQRPII
jgi:hypothetical protein